MIYSSGRFHTRHTSVTFDRSGKSRTFAAYKSTGSTVDMEMEREAASQDILSQKTFFFRLTDGFAQTGYR